MRSSPEFDLIAAIARRLRPPAGSGAARGIGDDAAVTTPAGATATSVDAVVDGVHFRRRWADPASIGHKALAAALSDLAAMGAAPGEAYVWLGRPDDLDRDGCLQIAEGIASLAARCGVEVLGGDLTAAPALALAVTVVGHAATAGELVGRNGARPGDTVCVTGELGGAAAGLLLLEERVAGASISDSERDGLRARQLRPEPRLGAGQALARAGARAMIDVSDGLGADAEQIAAASGTGLRIELGAVPRPAGLAALAQEAGRDAHDLLAAAGDDLELLCTLPPRAVEGAREGLAEHGLGLTEIGVVVEEAEVVLSLPEGSRAPARGHDHLAR